MNLTSKQVPIRLDPLMADKVAYLQAITVKAGHKQPSVSTVCRYAIDYLTFACDDLIAKDNAVKLGYISGDMNQRSKPKESAFTKTPVFTLDKNFQQLSTEAHKQRFAAILENL